MKLRIVQSQVQLHKKYEEKRTLGLFCTKGLQYRLMLAGLCGRFELDQPILKYFESSFTSYANDHNY
jgi:hypothetical protein